MEFVNTNVTSASVLPVTRLEAGMVMDTSVGTEMPPLGAPADGTVSVSVCTVMPVIEPVVAAAPMVNPESVMVTAVPALMVAPEVVITIVEAAVVAAGARDREFTFVPPAAKVGVMEFAKNPEG